MITLIGHLIVSSVDKDDNTISIVRHGASETWLNAEGVEELIQDLQEKLKEMQENEK